MGIQIPMKTGRKMYLATPTPHRYSSWIIHVVSTFVMTLYHNSVSQVGAAISMTYTTGQPIVFVGTGQRYTDIKSLNVQAVVSVLLK